MKKVKPPSPRKKRTNGGRRGQLPGPGHLALGDLPRSQGSAAEATGPGHPASSTDIRSFTPEIRPPARTSGQPIQGAQKAAPMARTSGHHPGHPAPPEARTSGPFARTSGPAYPESTKSHSTSPNIWPPSLDVQRLGKAQTSVSTPGHLPPCLRAVHSGRGPCTPSPLRLYILPLHLRFRVSVDLAHL